MDWSSAAVALVACVVGPIGAAGAVVSTAGSEMPSNLSSSFGGMKTCVFVSSSEDSTYMTVEAPGFSAASHLCETAAH